MALVWAFAALLWATTLAAVPATLVTPTTMAAVTGSHMKVRPCKGVENAPLWSVVVVFGEELEPTPAQPAHGGGVPSVDIIPQDGVSGCHIVETAEAPLCET